jgi:hypothetical protein
MKPHVTPPEIRRTSGVLRISHAPSRIDCTFRIVGSALSHCADVLGPRTAARFAVLAGLATLFNLFVCPLATAAPDSSKTEWFPASTLFPPLFANHEEPRMGIQQEIGKSRMKVGIGNALDVLEYRRGNDTVRASVLFFAYALANDYRGYRLKIDAADGFFGLGFSYHTNSPLSFRFRILHLSAHLVDGHYNDELQMWRDGRMPFPFSRNYGDLTAAYAGALGQYPTRLYVGLSYAPIVKPQEIRKWTTFVGCELRTPGSTHEYIAYHFTLMGTPTVIGSNSLEAGVKFGEWQHRGARLFLTYQNGWDNFGEYYNLRHEAVALGFAFDFW